MGLLFVDKTSEFVTRLSVKDIAAVVRAEGENKNGYVGLTSRMNKVEFFRLTESSTDDAFSSIDFGDREDFSVGIQQIAALTGKPTWTLQVYIYDDVNRRRVRLRILGNRDVVGAAKKLAGNIERAAS